MPLSFVLPGDVATILESAAGLWAGLVDGVRHEADRAIEVVVYSGEDALCGAAPDWQALERQHGAATAFQRLDVATAAMRPHLARNETPHIAVVRETGRAKVVLPMVAGRMLGLRTLRFFGDPLIQYGDAIAAPDAEERHFAAAWRSLANPTIADVAVLRKVRADAKLAAFLCKTAPAVVQHDAPFVDLTRAAPFDESRARQLRRHRRRLLKRGELTLAVERGEAALSALRQALALKRRWLDGRGQISAVIGDEDWEAALSRLADAPAATSPLVAICLLANRRPVAIEIALAHGQRWHSYLGAIEPEFARCGPGRVQIEESLAYCRREGLAIYDLLAPADDFKLALATGVVPVRDHIAAFGTRGRAALYLYGLTPHIKAMAARMPSRPRRLLRALMTGHG